MCWDDHDLMRGRPTGALRASLGAVSTFEEVYLLLRLLRRYFIAEDACVGDAVAAVASGMTTSCRDLRTGITVGSDAGAKAACSTACLLRLSEAPPVSHMGPMQSSETGTSVAATGAMKATAAAMRVTAAARSPPAANDTSSLSTPKAAGRLTHIFVFPVKSCASMQVCRLCATLPAVLPDRLHCLGLCLVGD